MALDLLSRRFLLAGLGGTATIGVLAAGQSSAVQRFAARINPLPKGRRRVPLATAAYAEWSAQVGSLFTAPGGSTLKLVNVRAYPALDKRPGGVRPQGFVVDFELAKGTAPGSGLTRLAHAEGGTFDIFLGKSVSGKAGKPGVFAEFN